MNILIADDHDLYREALAVLVARQFPNAIITQANDFESLLHLSNTHSDWAAFLIDLNMPKGEYTSSAKQLQAQHANTPIVVISSSEQTQDTQLAMRHGALGYITKSMTNDQISQSLSLMLNTGISIHPTAQPEPSHAIELTPRQKEVLNRMCEGASNKRIALDMSLSESTVKIHVRAILASLNVSNRTEAVLKAKAESII